LNLTLTKPFLDGTTAKLCGIGYDLDFYVLDAITMIQEIIKLPLVDPEVLTVSPAKFAKWNLSYLS
jgi:hypothetical protein